MKFKEYLPELSLLLIFWKFLNKQKFVVQSLNYNYLFSFVKKLSLDITIISKSTSLEISSSNQLANQTYLNPFIFQMRGTVSAFANVCAKMSNFVQTKWFTVLCTIIGIHWTFLFFAIVCFVACFYTVIYFPETRKKTIDEIYSKLSGKVKKDDTRIDSTP